MVSLYLTIKIMHGPINIIIFALYGTRSFTVVFTRTRHLSVPKPGVREILRLTLILCPPLPLRLQSILILQVSHHDPVHISHPRMLHVSPILSCLTFITQVIFVEENNHETRHYAIFAKKKCILRFVILILENIWSPSCCLSRCHSGKRTTKTVEDIALTDSNKIKWDRPANK